MFCNGWLTVPCNFPWGEVGGGTVGGGDDVLVMAG